MEISSALHHRLWARAPQTSQEAMWGYRSELFEIHREPRKDLGPDVIPDFTAQKHSPNSHNFPKAKGKKNGSLNKTGEQ